MEAAIAELLDFFADPAAGQRICSTVAMVELVAAVALKGQARMIAPT